LSGKNTELVCNVLELEKGVARQIIGNQMIFYLNSNGHRINISITRHAVFAFKVRYLLLFKKPISLIEAQANIIYRFPLADRVSNLSGKEKIRIKRHGHSLYFRDSDFTFIIHNGAMVTVEISKKGYRVLN